MRKLITILIFIFCSHSFLFGQSDSAKTNPGQNIKQFWLVMIKTGPRDKEITDSTERSQLFAGHFSNMLQLNKEGILKIAGPFGKNDFSWRGLFVFDCITKEEAEMHVKKDPAVAAGIFVVDIVPWYSEPSGSLAPTVKQKE